MPNTALPRPEAGLCFGDQQQTYLLISFLSQLALDVEGPWGSFMHLRTCFLLSGSFIHFC